jgi:hypothetical protein
MVIPTLFFVISKKFFGSKKERAMGLTSPQHDSA